VPPPTMTIDRIKWLGISSAEERIPLQHKRGKAGEGCSLA
jgi:hypothetical protein